MQINIKEIFTSDLDPNSNAWWSQDKIDKINHNFTQFTLGGMVGPMGMQGEYGSDGSVGPQGFLGNQGSQGNQGFKGISGNSNWNLFQNNEGTYSFVTPAKRPDDLLAVEYTPVVVGIGYNNPTDRPAISYLTSVLTVNSYESNEFGALVNMRLDGGDTNTVSEHQLLNDGGVSVYEEGRIRSGDGGFFRVINLHPNNSHKIQVPNTSVLPTSVITTTNNLVTFDVIPLNTSILQVSPSGNMTYNNDASTDDILVAIDSTGKSKWENPNLVFPGFKTGMIIAIPSAYFNSDNFELETIYTQTPGEPVRFKFGRGKIGTQFEKYYLCNGQKWNNSPGINETSVPNLNLTNISIDADPGEGQLNISINESASILAGHPIEISADYISSNTYDITYLNEFTSNDLTETIVVNQSNPTKTLDLSKLIYLVKLERNDLEWEQSENAAPITTTIALGNGESANIACRTLTISNYSWDGINWSSFDENTTNYRLYLHNTYTFAPSGYYAREGVSRYWNSTSGTFSSATPCGIGTIIELAYNVNVSALNNEVSQGLIGSYVLYGATSFIDVNASYLWDLSTNAPAVAGWYGTVNSGNTIRDRRYWDGSQFVGDVLRKRYITLISASSEPQLRIVNSFSNDYSCVLFSGGVNHPVYIETTDTFTTLNNVSDIASIIPTDSIIYSHVGWETGLIGTKPLIKIKNQPFPGSTDPNITVTHIVGGSGGISTSYLRIDSISTRDVGGTC